MPTPAEAIVRDLAAAGPRVVAAHPTSLGLVCGYCGYRDPRISHGPLSTIDKPEHHEASCIWRRAVEQQSQEG